jgi:hypothetical protein
MMPAGVSTVHDSFTDAVPAHLSLALVRLEEAHPEVGLLRLREIEDAVGPDAEAAVAVEGGKLGLHLLGHRRALVLVDKDEIIAIPFQLGKMKLHRE